MAPKSGSDGYRNRRAGSITRVNHLILRFSSFCEAMEFTEHGRIRLLLESKSFGIISNYFRLCFRKKLIQNYLKTRLLQLENPDIFQSSNIL